MRYFVLFLAFVLLMAFVNKRLHPKESFSECLFQSWVIWSLFSMVALFVYLTIKFW